MNPSDLLLSLLKVITSVVKPHFFLCLHFPQGTFHNNYKNVIWDTEMCPLYHISSFKNWKWCPTHFKHLGMPFSLLSLILKVSLNLSGKESLLSILILPTFSLLFHIAHYLLKHWISQKQFLAQFIHPWDASWLWFQVTGAVILLSAILRRSAMVSASFDGSDGQHHD